ncbi:hypothetical protein NQZ68_039998 [Dissostichus eleginoides]|nr:hypothetical protein NQZ68_039998 [Dissostichus eleginoides]
MEVLVYIPGVRRSSSLLSIRQQQTAAEPVCSVVRRHAVLLSAPWSGDTLSSCLLPGSGDTLSSCLSSCLSSYRSSCLSSCLLPGSGATLFSYLLPGSGATLSTCLDSFSFIVTQQKE